MFLCMISVHFILILTLDDMNKIRNNESIFISADTFTGDPTCVNDRQIHFNY